MPPQPPTKLVCPVGCEFEHALMGIDPAIKSPPLWFCSECMRPLIEVPLDPPPSLFELAWMQRWAIPLVVIIAAATLALTVMFI